jgi:uncharacterized protein (TIGR03435 family)
MRIECASADSLIRDAYVQFAHGPFWRRVPGVALPIPSVSQSELNLPVKGGTGWIQSEHFAIDAKASTPVAADVMLGPMLQELLKDRFKLRIHREPAEVPVYELTVSKGGAKLHPAKAGACRQLDSAPPPPRAKGQPVPPPPCGAFARSPNNAGVDMYGVTMHYLCLMLSMSADRELIDKTGLTGEFDVHLDASMEEILRRREANPPTAPTSSPVPTAPDPGGTLNDAIRKLGLTLRPAKKLIDAIVIDHVERPSPN